MKCYKILKAGKKKFVVLYAEGTKAKEFNGKKSAQKFAKSLGC